MKFSDMLHICFQDLSNKKSRTLLTVIGVVTGTCAILVMASIGIGMKKNQERMLNEMGDLKQIQIFNYNGNKPIDDNTIGRWQQLPGVKVVSPLYMPDSLNVQIQAKDKRYQLPYTTIIGVYPGALEEMGFEFLEKPGENGGSAREREGKGEEGGTPGGKRKGDGVRFRFQKAVGVVVGEAFAYAFTDTFRSGFQNQIYYEKDENGLPTKKPFVDLRKDRLTLLLQKDGEGEGKAIKKELLVNGRLKENSAKLYQSYDGIFMDINVVKEMEKMVNPKRVKKKKGYSQVVVIVKEIDDAADVEKAIKEDGYETNSLVDMRESLQKNRQQQMQMLYSTSLLAVFVAAVSIMNTMIMSVSERTKEIGVMKVLGCHIGDIRRLFLLESGTIGFGGGVVGIGVSYLISFLLNQFGSGLVPSAGEEWMATEGVAGAVSVLPVELALIGLVFATLVGVAAGFMPANRAVKIPALEAMKE